jgi:hypothetical protein
LSRGAPSQLANRFEPLELGPQPGDLTSVALLERLEPVCSPGDTVMHPDLLADAPGGGDCQQVSLAFMCQI